MSFVPQTAALSSLSSQFILISTFAPILPATVLATLAHLRTAIAPSLQVCCAWQVYQDEAQPVEDFFRRSGLLLDFEITGGIPETMPVLQDALRPYLWRKSPPPQQAVQSA